MTEKEDIRAFLEWADNEVNDGRGNKDDEELRIYRGFLALRRRWPE